MRESWSQEVIELKKLREETKKIFSEIGTEKSRQKLVYELLNLLKSKDWSKFKFLIVKSINTVITDERIGAKAKEYSDFLAELLDKYEAEGNFDKVGYALIMGIMSAGEKKEGELEVKNE